MTHTTDLTITPRAPFDFTLTVHSHGWAGLPPTSWDAEEDVLDRMERLRDGEVVRLSIYDAGSVEAPRVAIAVEHAGALSAEQEAEIEGLVRRILRADEDLRPFYALCRERGHPWREIPAGFGRLLRSPTLFEDTVKTICTTNIQWGGTRRMVQGLVDVLGAPYPGDRSLHAFPTAEAVAAASPETLTETVRMGYRGPYVHALAKRVASGELDLEGLYHSDLDTPALREKLLSIRGVGPYAAATLLMLIGHYDYLAVDTAFRQFVQARHFDGQRPTDAEARAIYADWGKWKYLAYWFERRHASR
ncbi:MAG: DNA-3-methyladenine glycosylase family protein [Anaerolineales bacterium]